MARKMNWDRVRNENRVWKNGSERYVEERDSWIVLPPLAERRRNRRSGTAAVPQPPRTGTPQSGPTTRQPGRTADSKGSRTGQGSAKTSARRKQSKSASGKQSRKEPTSGRSSSTKPVANRSERVTSSSAGETTSQSSPIRSSPIRSSGTRRTNPPRSGADGLAPGATGLVGRTPKKSARGKRPTGKRNAPKRIAANKAGGRVRPSPVRRPAKSSRSSGRSSSRAEVRCPDGHRWSNWELRGRKHVLPYQRRCSECGATESRIQRP